MELVGCDKLIRVELIGLVDVIGVRGSLWSEWLIELADLSSWWFYSHSVLFGLIRTTAYSDRCTFGQVDNVSCAETR